jgi:hypothetical protein
LALNNFPVALGKLCLGFDFQTTGVLQQLIDALVGDFAIEEFADSRLRLSPKSPSTASANIAVHGAGSPNRDPP